MMGWVAVADRLPSKEEFGAYPTVLVARAIAGQPWLGMFIAELHYLGGDPARPIWMTQKPCQPLENGSLYVTHWHALPELPATPA